MPYNPQGYTRFDTPAVPTPTRHDPFPIAGSDAPEAIEFGRLLVNGQRTNRLRYGGENHVLIFGKSGSGKDTRLLIPNLLQMSGNRSIVAVDPKGEMAAVTAPHRSRLGRVVILNPFEVLADLQGYDYMEGCGFNPLAALDPSSPDFNVDAGLLAEALIPLNSNVKDPHWPLSGRALVSGLIMYEVAKAAERWRTPMLFNVRRMICEAAAEEVAAKTIAGILVEGVPAKGIPAYAQEMANSIIMGMANKGGQFINWTKEVQSIASTVRSETEFLDDPQMAYSLARNDFDFNEVKQRCTTVYLVLPMKVMQRHGKWLRLLLTAALQACMRPRAYGEPRTLFIFNEFAALGHLQLIEDNFTVVRGAGIQMMPVLQDLNQLKQIYDKRWQTFIANADVTATFAPNDTETAEWFSKRCGETSKRKITVTENWSQNSGNSLSQGQTATGETSGSGVSGGWSFSRTANHSYEKEPFVTPYDLYGMKPGEMRIIRAGMANTFHAHALPYYQMRGLMEETRPPLNPYAPGVNIPRVARPARRYDDFFNQMRGRSPVFPESVPAGFNAGTDDRDSGDRRRGQSSERNLFDEIFGGAAAASTRESARPGDAPSPPEDPLRTSAPRQKPFRPQTPDNVSRDVQARHPGFTPDPPKPLPDAAARRPPDEGGDGWEDGDGTEST